MCTIRICVRIHFDSRFSFVCISRSLKHYLSLLHRHFVVAVDAVAVSAVSFRSAKISISACVRWICRAWSMHRHTAHVERRVASFEWYNRGIEYLESRTNLWHCYGWCVMPPFQRRIPKHTHKHRLVCAWVFSALSLFSRHSFRIRIGPSEFAQMKKLAATKEFVCAAQLVRFSTTAMRIFRSITKWNHFFFSPSSSASSGVLCCCRCLRTSWSVVIERVRVLLICIICSSFYILSPLLSSSSSATYFCVCYCIHGTAQKKHARPCHAKPL